ncbi:MAG: type II toxin-antitoxin system HicB family antitoxin [Chloroflexi bacterium]|nr:type II toxin-antitoxin system HicB family antitoxin [Chloroflexota bacterium]
MVDVAQTTIEFRAEVFKEGKTYVALCPELNVSSFGPTLTRAKTALREAVSAFAEGCLELGTLEEVMEEAGFHRQEGKWISRSPLAQERLTTAL